MAKTHNASDYQLVKVRQRGDFERTTPATFYCARKKKDYFNKTNKNQLSVQEKPSAIFLGNLE